MTKRGFPGQIAMCLVVPHVGKIGGKKESPFERLEPRLEVES